MTDLQALKTELAAKLTAKDEAIKTAFEAEQAYLLEFNRWQIENKEVVSASDIAVGKEQVAKKEFAETRKRISAELSAHFTEHPEAAKIEPAFGMRRSIEAVYEDEIEFIKAVIESGMLFLLKPDDAAITAFVKGMAIEVDDPVMPHLLPEKVMNNLPVLGIQTVFKATISDKKLQG
ncbi:hypothetical protein LCGC14_2476100 [marine sediment metagenome]|uniref:Uncharacterized protein n=1 Tax=marine sediment metagenome TaxID=412755 RepID=A0A0F9B9R1_9ZZZZ